jgi:hypothetical protein
MVSFAGGDGLKFLLAKPSVQQPGQCVVPPFYLQGEAHREATTGAFRSLEHDCKVLLNTETFGIK